MALPRESKGEKARTTILESAIRLFAKTGYSATSFQTIADDCGFNKTAVLYHFKSREELILAAIQRVTSNNYEIVSRGISMKDNALERIRKHFKLNLKWAQDYPSEAQLIVLLYYLSSQDTSMRKLYTGMRARAAERIEVYLHAAKREGLISSSYPLPDLSLLLHDTLVGGFIHYLGVRTPENSIAKLEKRWNFMFESVLSNN